MSLSPLSPCSDYGYDIGFINPYSSGRYIEREHEFWRVYIYSSFAFFILELLYAWVMIKAYYVDKQKGSESVRRVTVNQPAQYSITVSGQPMTIASDFEGPPPYADMNREPKGYMGPPPAQTNGYSFLKTSV